MILWRWLGSVVHKMSDSHRSASVWCEIVHLSRALDGTLVLDRENATHTNCEMYCTLHTHIALASKSNFIGIDGKLSRARQCEWEAGHKVNIFNVHLYHGWIERFTWLLWNWTWRFLRIIRQCLKMIFSFGAPLVEGSNSTFKILPFHLGANDVHVIVKLVSK